MLVKVQLGLRTSWR